MREGDIIVDADLLAQALGSPSTHAHPAHVKALAAQARDFVTSKAPRQKCDVYIVSASPNAAKTIPHDTVIECIPTLTECLARAKRRPAWTASAIREWFEKYVPGEEGSKLRSRRW